MSIYSIANVQWLQQHAMDNAFCKLAAYVIENGNPFNLSENGILENFVTGKYSAADKMRDPRYTSTDQ